VPVPFDRWRWDEKVGLLNRDALSSQAETHRSAKKEAKMERNISNSQTARNTQKEAKEAFAFYIGIDLGDKHSDVCVLDSAGEVSQRFRLRMKAPDLQAYFTSIRRSRAALEAGGQSRWVAELIEGCGHEVFVSNTRKVPYISQSNDKDDPGDAYKLAELLYLKPRLLHPIQHRSEQTQADLSWIRARAALVESRTQLINTVRAISKSFGERLAKCSTESFTAKQAEQIPPTIRGALAPLLEMLDQLNEKITFYDEMMEHIARTRYPKYCLLNQVGGVGVHTALLYMLTIGDPERFQKSRSVGCFLGMRPKKQDSGENKPQLGITKAGDVYLRKILVNCAHHILGPRGQDSDLRRFGLRICERGGKNAKKRAVVAVARKLSVLLHRLWVTGDVYESLRNSKAAAA
jgi:transposase